MKTGILIAGVVLVMSLAIIEWFLVTHHHGPHWMAFSGFFALFGVLVCITLIVVAKFFGKLWLQKQKDYYDNR